MNGLMNLTAVELIDKIKTQPIRVLDVMQQVINRVAKTKQLNAFINTNETYVLSRAEKLDANLFRQNLLPLHGLPFAVKDNIDTKDYITTGGTPALINNKPRDNADVVEKLINAGAIVIGKTNLHELAYGITNNNAFFGPVHNPYYHDLIPGGSSGGTAAAVAARLVPVGLGTDTGGSTRIPAALCGICGYRPSTGRYPGQGIINISHTRDTIGTFARSVEDIQLIDEVLTGDGGQEIVELENLRIGIPTVPFYLGLDKDVAEVIQAALERLKNSKFTFLHKDIEGLYELNEKVGFPIVLHETIPDLHSYITSHDLTIDIETLIENIASLDVKNIIKPLLGEGAIPVSVYQDAKNKHRPKLQQLYQDYFENHRLDAIIYPTTPLTARPIGQDDSVQIDGSIMPTFSTYIRNCDPSANAGIPSLSIPAGLTGEQLPVGISIDGPAGSDRKLLSIGAAIQAILPQIAGPDI